MSSSREETFPLWARALGAQGFHAFIALVEGYFTRRNIPIRLDADEGVLRPTPGALEQSSVFGLQNLAQTCSQSARDRWSGLIESHFDCIFVDGGQPHTPNALTMDVSDFERMRPFIRSRLYPLDLLAQSVETVHQAGPEGTLEVIVLDLPKSVRTVARSEAAAWPVPCEALFKIGRDNLRCSGPLKDNAVQVHPGLELHLYTGDAFYAASHALIMADYLPPELPFGALVGIPKRDILLAHHIHNIGVREAIGAMLHVIIGMHEEGPGSLAPNLYWHRQGEFVNLHYSTRDGLLEFTPLASFAGLLERLADRASRS